MSVVGTSRPISLACFCLPLERSFVSRQGSWSAGLIDLADAMGMGLSSQWFYYKLFFIGLAGVFFFFFFMKIANWNKIPCLKVSY